MSKKRKTASPSGKKKGGISTLLIKIFERKPGEELTHKEVCQLIDARDPATRQMVFDSLNRLVESSVLKRTNHFTFSLGKNNSLFEGIIQLTQRGSGFVVCDGEEKDIFIAPQNIGQALNGDSVKVRVFKKGPKRDEGAIVEIKERARTQFVGTLQFNQKGALLIPDNNRVSTEIQITKENLNGAREGEKVLVKIIAWPKSSGLPYGEVSAVIGMPGTNDTEMLSILYNQGIDPIFPQAVINEAEFVPIDLDSKEIESRRDFRAITTFTIDPLDARDFDDAISFRKLENGHFEIGVHIADVSHYVRPGSAMDSEALRRSNSVYLVDRVIPMLPEQLSNIACSLRPNEDKYTFSSVFEIDASGKVFAEWFGKTAIHSDRRFTYEEAQEIIEGKDGDFKEEILIIDKIAKILRKARLNQGALSIESEEMRFKLDDKGNPNEVIIKTSKDAHKLVEEFMLLANRHVATYLSKPKKGKDLFPMIYRVHDTPDPAKIQLFAVFIEKFGYKLDLQNPAKIAQNLNALFEDVRFKNEYSLIQTMAIRSMAKAAYDTVNIGHYGLAFQYYSHFTSPIRRYADLVVHRILQEELTNQKHLYGMDLSELCKKISKNERKAAEAERESTKYFQTLFVLDYIGEVFSGTISGIAEHGMFVRMDANHCEGMVAMLDIPGDRFYFDMEKFRIVGAKTKKEYNFGDKVQVLVQQVNPRKRQIDLELVPAP
jgi:ribonuclease R